MENKERFELCNVEMQSFIEAITSKSNEFPESIEKAFKILKTMNDDIAIESIKKINNEIYLGKIFFKVFELQKVDLRSWDMVLFELVKKINDQEVLYRALLETLKPNKYGNAPSSWIAYRIIEKIDDEILKQLISNIIEINKNASIQFWDLAFLVIKKISIAEVKDVNLVRKTLQLGLQYKNISIESIKNVKNFFTMRFDSDPIIEDLKIDFEIIKKIKDEEILENILYNIEFLFDRYKSIQNVFHKYKSVQNWDIAVYLMKTINNKDLIIKTLNTLFEYHNISENLYDDLADIFSLLMKNSLQDKEIVTMYQKIQNKTLKIYIQEEIRKNRFNLLLDMIWEDIF